MKDISSLFLASLINPAAAGLALLLAPIGYVFGQGVIAARYEQAARERFDKYGPHIYEALDTVEWYRSLDNPTSQDNVKFNIAKEVLWHNNVLH